jgi:hypothetical protein
MGPWEVRRCAGGGRCGGGDAARSHKRPVMGGAPLRGCYGGLRRVNGSINTGRHCLYAAGAAARWTLIPYTCRLVQL